MINYIEKGKGLHTAIANAGHWLVQRDGVWESSNDVVVQSIINDYNELPDYKAAKIDTIKSEGLLKIKAIFPAIQTFDDLALLRELYLSILQAARSPTTNWQKMIDIYQAGQTAVAAVNNASSKNAVDAVTPSWPT